jgi:hypothetical protein
VRRRGSIGRLMIAVGMSALALALLRGWLGPENVLGFLGPMAALVILGLAARSVTSGRIARFFSGVAATGLVLGVASLVEPSTVLGSIYFRLERPVGRWVQLPLKPARFRGGTAILLLPEEFGDADRPIQGPAPLARLSRRAGYYGRSTEFQAVLTAPQLLLAVVGGLIASGLRPRSTAPPAAPTDHE